MDELALSSTSKTPPNRNTFFVLPRAIFANCLGTTMAPRSSSPKSDGYGSIPQTDKDADQDGKVLNGDSDHITADGKASARIKTCLWNHQVVLVFSAAALAVLIYFIVQHYGGAVERHHHGKNAASPRHVDPALHPGHSATEVERFYNDQILDHFAHDDDGVQQPRWTQRYYEEPQFFPGPGHPLFVVMGGEDAVDDILYPFVSQTLGQRLGAHTICIEHRFYGTSRPLAHFTNADLRNYLSVRQALADAARVIAWKQQELGCGPRGSDTYCPVITFGGSYPGFLAVLMRLVHDDIVDIGYGSSAPLHLYSHDVNQLAYFDKITAVAEQAAPGCADATRTALHVVQHKLAHADATHFTKWAPDLGVCPDHIPSYITDNKSFLQEIMMIIATHFAENNMGYYPPGPQQELVLGCNIFLNDTLSPVEKVAGFLKMREGFDTCFDMRSELPPGPNGTISAADWSGVGDGHSGYMWDYQSCTLIPECGMGPDSMFVDRRWNMDWLTDHCQTRFGYTPHRNALVDEFHFESLSNATRIVFTNGINDGWSVASIVTNVSDTVVAVNFPNGAHHSDLSHVGPNEHDTDDIKAGHVRIADMLSDWLQDVRDEYKANQ